MHGSWMRTRALVWQIGRFKLEWLECRDVHVFTGRCGDDNKNLELQYRGRMRELKKLIPVRSGESDLFQAMKQIAETGKGPEEQIPSAGCGIKWKFD